MTAIRPTRLLLPLLALAGPLAAQTFPAPHRPVASIVSASFSTEDRRESVREAEAVMNETGTKAGMQVADVGAGEGYYTIHLARRVGPRGHVVAEDIVPQVRDQLAARVAREKLGNVTVTLGTPADAKLPAAAFDRIFLIHMYHEIEQPYELLWRLRPALRPGGRLVIVDANRPTQNHGTPPALLDCELSRVGYRLVRRTVMQPLDAYVAQYEPRGPRPEPQAIRACG